MQAKTGAITTVCTALFWASGVSAQAPETPSAPPLSVTKSKPKAAPAKIVMVVNDSPNTLTSLSLSGLTGDPVVLKSPLPPAKKVSVNLSRMKGCTVDISAQFENVGSAEVSKFNFCKDKLLHFTE